MSKIAIRRATEADIPAIMAIYKSAREFMRSRGNASQWVNGYPSIELIREDIACGYSYVGDVGGQPVFVFAFIIGEDATYADIQGQWLNDKPYGTIHRIASSGVVTSVVEMSVEFCLTKIYNIRIDTHQCNIPMKNALKRIGFADCGIIHLADGSPRIAYQLPS